MSKRVHKSTERMFSILESSGNFKSITGGADFSKKMRASVRKGDVYRPDAEPSGFGSRPSFSLGSDFGTIKSDPQAYTKILRGEARKSDRKVARHTRKMLKRPHRAKRPPVDPEIMAKYSKKKTHRAPRLERPTPSVALVYSYDARSLSLNPQFAFSFKGMKDATKALRRGDLLTSSLVHFSSRKGSRFLSPTTSLEFYLQSSNRPIFL